MPEVKHLLVLIAPGQEVWAIPGTDGESQKAGLQIIITALVGCSLDVGSVIRAAGIGIIGPSQVTGYGPFPHFPGQPKLVGSPNGLMVNIKGVHFGSPHPAGVWGESRLALSLHDLPEVITAIPHRFMAA